MIWAFLDLLDCSRDKQLFLRLLYFEVEYFERNLKVNVTFLHASFYWFCQYFGAKIENLWFFRFRLWQDPTLTGFFKKILFLHRKKMYRECFRDLFLIVSDNCNNWDKCAFVRKDFLIVRTCEMILALVPRFYKWNKAVKTFLNNKQIQL